MKDITSLKTELLQCESELASITKDNYSDCENYSYTNYVDPLRAKFLRGKIEFIQLEIETRKD